jgi:glycosyltransferase involved in cell wall biosynthesis
LKIAFISHEFPPDTGKGGIGTYVSQIARAIAAEGNEVHVFAGSNYREGTEHSNGYIIYRIQCLNGNDFKEKVVNNFSIENTIAPFDLMESPEINGNAWEIKKKFPSIPLVVRLHAPNYLVESLKKTYLPFTAKLRFVLGAIRRFKFDLGYWAPYDRKEDPDYRFIQLADYITAPSQAMKDWVINNWQIAPDKISVIPNIFSPSPDFLSIPVAENTNYKRVIFFGRLNALKGLVNATFAIKKILKKYPDWSFRVIGDDGPGPNNNITMRNWMKGQLKEVENRVEFMDGMDHKNLSTAISDGEIVLLPSLFESFSYTCAEAMAAGKAVIGSNNAGMVDLIENHKSGILVNPYDYHEIFKAIKKLIDDNFFRVAVSELARKRIINNFNNKKTVVEFNEFYDRISSKQFLKKTNS